MNNNFQYCVNKEFHNFVLNNSTKTKTYKLSPTAAIFFCPNRTFNSCDNYQYNGLRFVCIFADNMFTIKSKYDILKIVNTAKEEKEDPKMKRKRTHTILATITLISVILTSACSAGSASSTTSSAPETAVTTTAPAVTGTVMDRIDEPKAEATTAQTTAITAVTTAKPQETKKVETTAAATAVTTAKPKPATTTTVATTKPTPEWTESKASGTKYVNTDCYSRKKAVLGAETVKLYSVNDKVTVTAKTDTGYFKLSDGSFIHGDYLSDNKVAQTTITTTKKAEAPKPSQTTTKKQESKPKSIYEYPFDLEAIKKVIVDDAVNNYGLKNLDDPDWTPEGSTWNVPLVISYDMHPNVIKRNVEDEAGANFRVAQMKKGDYFKVYIRDISEDMDVRDENGKLTKAYAIYFLRG